jgi:hypothetical protein
MMDAAWIWAVALCHRQAAGRNIDFGHNGFIGIWLGKKRSGRDRTSNPAGETILCFNK